MTPTTDLSAAAAAMGKRGGKSTSEAKRAASRENGKRGGSPKGGNKMYYAAESDKGLSMTYDSPCWQVLAFTSKAERDNYVKAHSDKAEAVDYKTACRVAPQLRTEAPGTAWRTVLM